MIGTLQHKKLEKLFSVLDFDKNGFIESCDFTDSANSLLNARDIKPNTKERQDFIDLMLLWWDNIREAADTDHDNKVTVNEFIVFWSGLLGAAGLEGVGGPAGALDLIKNTASMTFDIMDSSHNGFVNAAEHADWINACKIDVDASALFKRLDTDNDGQLSRDYVINLVKEFFFTNDPEALGNFIYGPLI